MYNVDNGVCDSKGCSPCRKSRCKFAKSCGVLQRLFPGLLIRNIGIIFRLIVTHQMWYICWNVVFVVYNMLAVHVLRLELGLILISHAIVGLTGVLQGYTRLIFSGILPEGVIGGSLHLHLYILTFLSTVTPSIEKTAFQGAVLKI